MSSISQIAFAGQPNTGKSTLFNALTGARQHVANYPGITVEKKFGSYTYHKENIEVVDLPGTYSLTSYTPEERVSRDFILREKPETIVNIIDAVNLERQLIFTFQLLEMERPVVLYINKKDVAERRGLKLDPDSLGRLLGLPVVYGTARRGESLDKLKEYISSSRESGKISKFRVDYGEDIEKAVFEIGELLSNYSEQLADYPPRWLALKLLENDEEIRSMLSSAVSDSSKLFDLVERLDNEFTEKNGYNLEIGVSLARNNTGLEIKDKCLVDESGDKETITDKIDKVVLDRVGGPIILLGVMYVFYWITMVGGQKITDLVFPYFQLFRNLISGWLPADSLLFDGFLRSLLLNGIVDGVVMILNYLPIFYVLYLVIAFLEDSGYMARIAFIMDRILRSFGLHGQSTLPMILAGAIVGGCAVPGVMATRTIKDKKARIVTMLVLPLMNCMAKVPFYVLMTGIFFTNHQPLVLWAFSVSTLIVALLVAKLLSSTIVRGEPEPFVLELPSYQLPTVRGVFIRGTERMWLFIKKVATIVVAVSVMIWFGVTFPQARKDVVAEYENRYVEKLDEFELKVGADYGRFFAASTDLVNFMQFEDDYKIMKRRLNSSNKQALIRLNERFIMKNPEYAKIVLKGKIPLAESDVEPFTKYLAAYESDLSSLRDGTLGVTAEEFSSKYMNANPYYFGLVRTGNVSLKKNKVIDTQAKAVNKLWSSLRKDSLAIKRDLKKTSLQSSALGRMGKFMEPVSSLAGMDWRVNIAIIGSFAAKEALVSTLGTIYSIEDGSSAGESSLKSGIAQTGGFRPLHALAIMVFIALFPPCIATMMMIKVESGSWKWLAFAIVFPIILGFIAASIVFQVGLILGF